MQMTAQILQAALNLPYTQNAADFPWQTANAATLAATPPAVNPA